MIDILHACSLMRARFCALFLLGIAMLASSAVGATSSVVVSMTVPSATTLSTAGCASSTAGVTEFGSVVPGSIAVTSADCVLAWGSSNDTSMLRAFQADGIGTAMGGASSTFDAASPADTSMNENISAASASVAYVAGQWSGIHTTTDGGATWSTTPSPQPVNGISAAPGSIAVAVAVGDGGAIRRTTDSGAMWPTESSPVTSNLIAVSMSDADNGFAVGAGAAVVRRTTAGGATWASATTPSGATLLNGVSAVSATVAFVAGPGGVLRRTQDGGSTWAAPATACGGEYEDISASDADTAYAVGLSGVITRVTWDAATSTLSCAYLGRPNIGEDLEGVWAVPGTSTVYVAGALGTLHVSADSGGTWQRLVPATSVDLNGVSRAPDGSVWVAGGSGTVARATSGTTFAVRRVETTDSTTITAVAAASATRAIVVGGPVDRGGTWQAAIRTTTDGGTTWTARNSGTSNALFAVSAPSSSLAVAVGDDGTVTRSVDAGATWTASTVAAGQRLWSVDMADEYTGWAVGDGGTILKTSNGGSSWASQASPATTALRRVDAVNKEVAFAVGVGGLMLRTSDGGATWASVPGMPTTDTIQDVSAVDATTVWIVWGWRQVGRTVDANAATPTWTTMVTNSGNDSQSIDAVSRTAAWVGSSWSKVSRTLDGGATWTTADMSPSGWAFAYALDALDENTAWAAGGQNAVARSLPDPVRDVPDYADAGPNWSTAASSVFGACLRDSTGTGVVASWTVDAACATSGTGVWRAIPPTSAAPEAKVAGATAATSATARLRFGFKPAANQAPGRYSAGIAFEVIAPNA